MSEEPHPADVVRGLLQQQGRSQAWLGVKVAELEGRLNPYAQPTVGGWLDKIEEQPARRMFLIEEALGQRPGSITRLMGYLPVSARRATRIADVLAEDQRLTPTAREMILAAYEKAIGD